MGKERERERWGGREKKWEPYMCDGEVSVLYGEREREKVGREREKAGCMHAVMYRKRREGGGKRKRGRTNEMKKRLIEELRS